MTNHCTDSAPFKAAFQVTKPNGNRGAAEFSQSERLVFLGVHAYEVGAKGKRAGLMVQSFQPGLAGYFIFTSRHASACEGVCVIAWT